MTPDDLALLIRTIPGYVSSHHDFRSRTYTAYFAGDKQETTSSLALLTDEGRGAFFARCVELTAPPRVKAPPRTVWTALLEDLVEESPKLTP